jgi:hypothetical protein
MFTHLWHLAKQCEYGVYFVWNVIVYQVPTVVFVSSKKEYVEMRSVRRPFDATPNSYSFAS